MSEIGGNYQADKRLALARAALLITVFILGVFGAGAFACCAPSKVALALGGAALGLLLIALFGSRRLVESLGKWLPPSGV